MSKKRRGKKAKKAKQEDFGKAEFYCSNCGHHFEMDWERIWDIQELTHGYAGYHLNDTYISCEKCNHMISEDDQPFHKTNAIESSKMITGDVELPF
jgi:Fe2+ or Zn2+ uptake regulation protein